VLVVLVLAWQLLPAALTALVVFMMAGVLFAQGVDGIDVDTTPPPPPPSARGGQPSPALLGREQNTMRSTLNTQQLMDLRRAIRQGERAECGRCVCSAYRSPRELVQNRLM